VRKAPTFTFQITREGIGARLEEMEMRIDRLRSMYESYFMGMERTPPNTLRRDMNRMMLEMQQVPIGNASLRFRFQALTQKWVLHATYWNRTLREIESGTYRRDMARAQRHLAERGGVLTEEEALAIGIPKNRVKAFIARQQLQATKRTGENPAVGAAKAPANADASPPPPAPKVAAKPAPLPGLTDKDFEDAYRRYVDAHANLPVPIEPITKEKLRQRLGKQLPKILDEQKCQKLKLEIAVEEGKVRVRAWPADHP